MALILPEPSELSSLDRGFTCVGSATILSTAPTYDIADIQIRQAHPVLTSMGTQRCLKSFYLTLCWKLQAPHLNLGLLFWIAKW